MIYKKCPVLAYLLFIAKIIPILRSSKKIALSPLMVSTLKAAYKKQINHESFGQADLNGSFIALLKRCLIDVKTIPVKGEMRVSWYVTEEGVAALNNLSFSDPTDFKR